jgi:hypothetical protein
MRATKEIFLPGLNLIKVDFYRNRDITFLTSRKPTPTDLSADYVMGLSIGCLIILKNLDKITGKIILINPPLPKRNLFFWFGRWVRYLITEGLFLKRQHFTKNPFKIIGEFANAIKLLSINFEPLLESLPKDRITIIRGKDDKLCCDNQAAESLRSKGITVIDAEGGHNWSEGIEKALGELF